MSWDRTPRICWICGIPFAPMRVNQKMCRDDRHHHNYSARWYYWADDAYRKRARKNNRERARARYWRNPEAERARKRARYWAS
jgi:hypothetical protein